MCLAVWSFGEHLRFPAVLASNRDEFHDRPAQPLAWWRPEPGAPPILGGRDETGGGTWLGLRDDGRLALLTNVREPGRFRADLPTRGGLAVDALCRPVVDDPWLDGLTATPRNGWNLVVAELARGTFRWVSNRPPQRRAGGAGRWGLSNAGLDAPWPKVQRLKAALGTALAAADDVDGLFAAVFEALADRCEVPDRQLPHTGVPLPRERQLSPAFIHIPAAAGYPGYGTRCSTVVVVEALPGGTRRVHVTERRFDAGASATGQTRLDFTPSGLA